MKSTAPGITTTQRLEWFKAALEDGFNLARVVYCIDYDAETAYDRHEIDILAHSPIRPLTDKKLDRTVKYGPDLHYPLEHKSEHPSMRPSTSTRRTTTWYY